MTQVNSLTISMKFDAVPLSSALVALDEIVESGSKERRAQLAWNLAAELFKTSTVDSSLKQYLQALDKKIDLISSELCRLSAAAKRSNDSDAIRVS